MITLAQILKLLDTALVQSGTILFDDKGPTEVMDVGAIATALQAMPAADAARVIRALARSKMNYQRGEQLALSILAELRNWDELVDADPHIRRLMNQEGLASRHVDGPLTLHIPTIGEELTLAAPWAFNLYYERRNDTAVSFYLGVDLSATGLYDRLINARWENGFKFQWCTIAAGTVLAVERIYVRAGGAAMKEYDSITFRVISTPDGRKTLGKGKVRFWAKLLECNNIQYERL